MCLGSGGGGLASQEGIITVDCDVFSCCGDGWNWFFSRDNLFLLYFATILGAAEDDHKSNNNNNNNTRPMLCTCPCDSFSRSISD